MNRHGFGAAPLVMGLILEMVEEAFSQSMIIYDNNFLVLMESPIVLFFLALTAVNLSTPFWTGFKKRKA